jgi:hypothetical protein
MNETGNTTLDTIAVVLLVLAAPAANCFPVVYAFRPWRSSQIGRALMTKAVGLAIFIDVALLALVFPDYPLRPQIRVVAFSLVVVGIWYQFIAMARASHQRSGGDR